MKNDCKLWTGYVQSGGYGQLYYNGKRVLAHRHAWYMSVGDIPAGMMVCHHCDTPLCINIKHLFLGTAKDNSQDCVKKGRHVGGGTKRASRHRKLTDEDTNYIVNSKETLKVLALRFSVSMTCISMVRRGLRKNYVCIV